MISLVTSSGSIFLATYNVLSMYLKGQNLRVFVGESTAAVVACATSCAIDLTANTESASTKDDTGLIEQKEVSSVAGTVSVDALVLVSEQDTVKSALQLIGKRVQLECNITNGAQNRDKAGAIFTAEALCTSVSVNAQNKQNVSYSVKYELTTQPDFSPAS